MTIEFSIREWAAYAPALTTREAWLAWRTDPVPPYGEDRPALTELAPMMRRRVDRLGRMALQVAYWCQPGARHTPMIFASRHGDPARSLEMLLTMARDEPLSPTAFGLSVHNAIAAQYSIARGDTSNCQALSAGSASAEAALVEACGLLADGAEEVLVVLYDAPLPALYREFRDEPDPPYAWAWRVARPLPGLPHYSLETSSPAHGVPEKPLPHGLEVLRFVLAEEDCLEHVANGTGWRWRRHA